MKDARKQQTELDAATVAVADAERALQRAQGLLIAAQGKLREAEAECEAGSEGYISSGRDDEAFAIFITAPRAKAERARVNVMALQRDCEVAEQAVAAAKVREHAAQLAILVEPARYSRIRPLLAAFTPRIVSVLQELGQIDHEVRRLVDAHREAVATYRAAGGTDPDALARGYEGARADAARGCGNRDPHDGRLQLLVDSTLTEAEMEAIEKAQAEAFEAIAREDTRASREAAERRANEEERQANLQAQRDAEARRLQAEHDAKASVAKSADDRRSNDRRLGLASE